MLATSLAPAVLTVLSVTTAGPAEWKAQSDVAAGCAQIGSVQASDARQIADGGKQMVALQLRSLAERASADAYLPQFVGGGQATYTQGFANLFKCSGPWLGGGLPPPAWPYVTTSLVDRSFLPAPSTSGSGLGASAATVGELSLGSSYAQVKAILNSRGIVVKQASGTVDLSKGVPSTTAVLTPANDAKGRRWLYLGSTLAPPALSFGTSLMALGFDSQQTLVSIALLNFGEARGLRDFTKSLYNHLDSAYRRITDQHGPSYWTDLSQLHPLVALFSSNNPTPYTFILFTTDNFELPPNSVSASTVLPSAPFSSTVPASAASVPRVPQPIEATCETLDPNTPLGKALAKSHVQLCNGISLSGDSWLVSPSPSNVGCPLVARDQVSAKCPPWGTTSSTWGTLESGAAASRGDATANCLSAVGRRLADAAKRARANAVVVDAYDPSANKLVLSLFNCQENR